MKKYKLKTIEQIKAMGFKFESNGCRNDTGKNMIGTSLPKVLAMEGREIFIRETFTGASTGLPCAHIYSAETVISPAASAEISVWMDWLEEIPHLDDDLFEI